MHIQHLQLANFRNYAELDFDLPPGISVFQGANAQGKTNLLEAICFVATSRLSRPVPDKELIIWNALKEKLPFARISADVHRNERDVQLEIILRPRSVHFEDSAISVPIQKHIRVNGVARRAFDLVGQLNMVMFSPRDIDLICGEPSLRRRHLDITNSQVNPQYLRNLQRYNKVLGQRNHLLRQIAAGNSRLDELAFWDDELVKLGTYIVFQRNETISKISDLSNPIHDQLSGGKETLALRYQPNIAPETSEFETIDDVEQAFLGALTAAREKELARGQSLIGPHRDELRFLANEKDMGTYGSRGQQRTIALSIKLAEVRFMLSQTDQMPVLLLDDVLSELDSQRRQHLLDAIGEYQQVLVTATDPDRFPSGFLVNAARFSVDNGTIKSDNT